MTPKLRKLYNLEPSDAPLLFLAPMAGFTNAPMRRIAREHGADMTFTEMTSAAGLLHQQRKSWHLMERFEDEAPVVAHLYGADPESLAEAARKIENRGGFAGIDLNAGCPVRKVTKNGAGAALINDPQLIYRILAAMRKAITLPLSIKTRLGARPGKPAASEILKAAEDAGADAITIHARFTSQGHGGEPRLKLLAEIKSKAKIPVVGNGGVRSAWDARRMFNVSGVDAIMAARCAIGNPWLFTDIRAGLATGEPLPIHEPTRDRTRRNLDIVRKTLLRHLEDQRALLERDPRLFEGGQRTLSIESALVTNFRCHLFRYLRGLKGSSYLRGRLSAIKTRDDIIAAVDACLERERVYRANKPED